MYIADFLLNSVSSGFNMDKFYQIPVKNSDHATINDVGFSKEGEIKWNFYLRRRQYQDIINFEDFTTVFALGLQDSVTPELSDYILSNDLEAEAMELLTQILVSQLS